MAACRYQLRRSLLNPASAPALELISLDKEIIKFGRNPDQVQVVLHSNLCPNMISRDHAHIRQIRNNDGSVSYYLFDTSLNGTYVNDIRVNSSVLLHPGDNVKFGHVNGAAMAPGQPAPQPYAEFAYVFEKVPRSTSSQVHASAVASHQMHASGAYDATAKRLAASPHAWPTNPYAQLAATPAAAAAYFAATGFSHPYLGAIPPGLLTSPSAAASALAPSTTCLTQPQSANVAAFPGACAGSYPGMVGGSAGGSVASQHQQAGSFRPPSAVMAAAAAEAAAWLGVASVGQSAPVYQHHFTASAPQFTIGGHLNTPSMASDSLDNRQRFHQQYQQQQQHQQESIQNASSCLNRQASASSSDAFGTLASQQKPQGQDMPSNYSHQMFGQQRLRTQQYSTHTAHGNSGESVISANQQVPSAVSIPDKVADFIHQQTQNDGRSIRQVELGKNLSLSPSDCEILPPPPSAHTDRFTSTNTGVVSQPVRNADTGESNMIHGAPQRDSVLIEAHSVVGSYANASTCVTAPATSARVKQSLPASVNEMKELDGSAIQCASGEQDSSAANSGKTGFQGDLQKAECDSSVPSPPEDPVRRKSTGHNTSTSTNSGEAVQIIDQRSSTALNSDLLRLAADARSRCMNASLNNQDDMFDLEPIGGSECDTSKIIAPASSSSHSSDCDQSNAEASSDKHPSNETGIVTQLDSMDDNDEKEEMEKRKSPPMESARFARKKQRSNEVKRLFDDLQSSYLFNQKQKKAKRDDSDSSSSSEKSRESSKEREEKKEKSNESDDNSSGSVSDQSIKRRKAKPPLQQKQQSAGRKRRKSSSSSESSGNEDSEEEESSDSDVELGRLRSEKRPTRGRGGGGPGGRGGRGGRSGRQVKKKTGIPNVRNRSGGRGQSQKPAAGRPQKRKMDKKETTSVAAVIRVEDAWKFHDPAQSCAAGTNCVKPNEDNVDWVECDDCERWFHVNCVGCVFDEVKDEDTAFHCGCTS